MMGWYGDGGWGWAGWLVMTLMMVAFWGLVVWGLVAIFRGTTRSDDRNTDGGRTRDPLEILDERFARGEIDAEEYRARQDVLRTAVH
jgi:putative membrane protein